MSIKDITDYVRLTPGNTNPSVIGSMVQSEVNGTLKESKAYTDQRIASLEQNGQVGHSEPGKVYTYDGNIDNAEDTILIDEILYAQIATGEFDLSKVARAELVYYGQSVTLTSADMQVTMDADDMQKLIATVAGVTLPGIVCKDGKLFVFSMGEHHVKTVEFAETIYPIDPKFLPKGGSGYVGTVWVEVFPTTVRTPFGSAGTYGVEFIPEVGKEYEVTIDGVASTHTAVLLRDSFDSYICLGDTTASDNTGVKGFRIVCSSNGTATGSLVVVEGKKTEEITIGIKKKTEIVNQIDPKFIPGVVLPVVELVTLPSPDGAQLTEAETKQLAYAIENSNYALFALSFLGAFPIPVIGIKVNIETMEAYLLTVYTGTQGVNYVAGIEDGIGWINILT